MEPVCLKRSPFSLGRSPFSLGDCVPNVIGSAGEKKRTESKERVELLQGCALGEMDLPLGSDIALHVIHIGAQSMNVGEYKENQSRSQDDFGKNARILSG